MIVTLDEVKEHLRIDYDSEDLYLEILIKAAGEFIYNTTGIRFDNTNSLAKVACLFIISDLYENRNASTEKMNEKIRNIVMMILSQLSLSYESSDTL